VRETWAPPIVVGFDGSADSVRALDWAVAEAGVRDAPITLCHVRHQPRPDAGAGGDAADEPEATAQRMLAEGRRHAEQQVPDIHVRVELLDGDPARDLAEAARDAELLVVGARGTGGLHGRLLGSVSAQLARSAHCPVVVVVRDGAVRDESRRERGRRIVVGIGGPEDCETALPFAFGEAARRKGAVHAVHAFDEAAVRTVAYQDEGQLYRQRQAAQDSFGALLAPQADQHPGIAVSFELIHGGPAPALIETSADADLLVLGSHGHGRLATAVLGSTSQTVLHHAACPVAVVRGNESTPNPD
jgi:nucleotide-binding universal stress UspA family protein